MAATATTENYESQLADDIAQFVYDPLGFVYFAYPWGEGLLADETGPDRWQADILNQVGDGLLSTSEALQIAVSSGHGVGKTALIGWIIDWFSSTRPHPQIVVTANTKEQLTNKTWRELAKWHKLSINRHWFTWTATKFYHVDHPETWFASAVPWSKERSEAFAGTHEKHVLVLMDEASAIEDIIWEVTEGVMTTPRAIWIAFGNSTRSSGRFRECFGRFKHRWITREIDSRTTKKANKAQIQKWIDDYGEDSDFVRVRVKGQAPRSGSMQLIPSDIVNNALGKHLHQKIYEHAPRIIGVDVARFGDDQSVIINRQGLCASGLKKFRGLDTMQLASIVAQRINEYRPHAVFVDGVGIGAGVVDRLRQLGHENIIEVQAGSAAIRRRVYANKTTETWCLLRDWLKRGAAIPDDNELRDDLTNREYGFDGKELYQLEKKEDMKSRGLASPDCGDALAFTFAEPVIVETIDDRLELFAWTKKKAITEYDLFDSDF
jgi:hypothetical protein